MSLRFSPTELRDLAKAWIAIAVAFAIATSGFESFFTFSGQFLAALAVSAVTVGVGFLLHELAHKVVAQRYGCWAEFRSFDQMLGLAILMSFFGFIFAAPGAVFFRHGGAHISQRRQGHIAAAGPITNIILAAGFLALGILLPALSPLAVFGARINAWLAAFNMIPFLGLDGQKIMAWSSIAWGALLAASVAMMLASGF